MKKNLNLFGLIFLTLTLINCQVKPVAAVSVAPVVTAAPPPVAPVKTTISPESVAKPASELSVMTFNVENLFDTSHDRGTEDYTNLPLAKKKKNKAAQKFCAGMSNEYYKKQCFELDWTSAKLKVKLQNIADVIKFVDNGNGPDAILFAEVENIKVLRQLTREHLKKLGYKTVALIEGPDLRGIDPGFISKLPQVGRAKLHLIPYTDADPEKLKWAKRSRGILEVTVRAPNKKNITFLSAHFPSQANPTEWRAQAVNFAKNLMAEYQKQGRAVIFGGDLNIITSEEADKNYFKTELSQVGDVSHLIGCKDCLGSHNYRGDWSFLDVIVFSKNLKEVGFEVIPSSIQVVRSPHNTDADGKPKRYDVEAGTGVADHFPLYARIKYY